jgi:hypothetical protein
MRGTRGVAVLAVGAVALAGCGSSSDNSKPAAQKPAAKKIKVSVTAPSDGDRLGSSVKKVQVRGTVTPTNATVEVAGKAAKVTGGLFQATVPLSAGDNTLDVAATAPGSSPVTSSVDVVRASKPAKVASKPKPAPTPKPTPAPKPATKTVPSVVGQRLDVAEDTLHSKGIGYKEIGGGTFGIVVKSNWDVCQTEPSSGQTASGRVKLIVERNGGC